MRVDVGGSTLGLGKMAGDDVKKKLKQPARWESKGERL